MERNQNVHYYRKRKRERGFLFGVDSLSAARHLFGFLTPVCGQLNIPVRSARAHASIISSSDASSTMPSVCCHQNHKKSKSTSALDESFQVCPLLGEACIRIHIATHSHLHAKIQTYTPTYIHIYIHLHILHTHIHTYSHTHVHNHRHTRIHTRVHTYINVSIHTNMHTSIRTSTHIHTHDSKLPYTHAYSSRSAQGQDDPLHKTANHHMLTQQPHGK